jgi:DNA-binding NarL/FixJ family response regulator
MLRRAAMMLALEAAVEQEVARMVDLAREFGASDDDIAAALKAVPAGPTERLERELHRMDSRVHSAEKNAAAARAQLERATATIAATPVDRRDLVVELLAAGVGVREVARRTGLSASTVSHHRKRWAAGLMRDADRATG